MILLATSRQGKQPDMTKIKKKLERTQRHKEAEGAAAKAAVSDPTEDPASPYSRATPILSEC